MNKQASIVFDVLTIFNFHDFFIFGVWNANHTPHFLCFNASVYGYFFHFYAKSSLLKRWTEDRRHSNSLLSIVQDVINREHTIDKYDLFSSFREDSDSYMLFAVREHCNKLGNHFMHLIIKVKWFHYHRSHHYQYYHLLHYFVKS